MLLALTQARDVEGSPNPDYNDILYKAHEDLRQAARLVEEGVNRDPILSDRLNHRGQAQPLRQERGLPASPDDFQDQLVIRASLLSNARDCE